MSTPPKPHLAIIGGGFCGTMALANFIQIAPSTCPIKITWFEEKHTPGVGVAYGTAEPIHLLNVRAGFMGAFANDPSHFFHWLGTPSGKQAARIFLKEQEISEETYVPRLLYGEYLKHIAAEAIKLAHEKSIELEVIHTSVQDISLTHDAPARLEIMTDTMQLTVNSAILATGSPAPRMMPFLQNLPPSHPCYINDVWHNKKAFSQAHIASLSAESTIVIIGTSLTAVDTILSLEAFGFKGKILALSRNGLLPQMHKHVPAYPVWEWTKTPQNAPHSALGLLVGLRAQVRTAGQQGFDWRGVVDSIRPVTQNIWQQLPTAEKKRFFKRLSTFWGIHRHRIASSIHASITSLQTTQKLTILAASILSVLPEGDGLVITYKYKKKAPQTQHATLLVNCTSPDYDVRHSSHGLMHNLYTHGMITAHPTGPGISVTDQGASIGPASHALYAIGPLRVGDLLESIAVPELRAQAQKVAQTLLAQFGCC